jgi:hypothetical protein
VAYRYLDFGGGVCGASGVKIRVAAARSPASAHLQRRIVCVKLRRMKLTPEQESTVRSWVADKATLNDLQNRLRDEMNIRMTFMDVRFLVLDLGVELYTAPPEPEEEPEEEPLLEAGFPNDAVQVMADEITLPGTMASGKVNFSDGVQASWYVDQSGRLGVQAPEVGYKPPTEDVASFQAQLQAILKRLGMY